MVAINNFHVLGDKLRSDLRTPFILFYSFMKYQLKLYYDKVRGKFSGS